MSSSIVFSSMDNLNGGSGPRLRNEFFYPQRQSVCATFTLDRPKKLATISVSWKLFDQLLNAFFGAKPAPFKSFNHTAGFSWKEQFARRLIVQSKNNVHFGQYSFSRREHLLRSFSTLICIHLLVIIFVWENSGLYSFFFGFLKICCISLAVP